MKQRANPGWIKELSIETTNDKQIDVILSAHRHGHGHGHGHGHRRRRRCRQQATVALQANMVLLRNLLSQNAALGCVCSSSNCLSLPPFPAVKAIFGQRARPHNALSAHEISDLSEHLTDTLPSLPFPLSLANQKRGPQSKLAHPTPHSNARKRTHVTSSYVRISRRET